MTYTSRKSKGAIDYCSDLQGRSTKSKRSWQGQWNSEKWYHPQYLFSSRYLEQGWRSSRRKIGKEGVNDLTTFFTRLRGVKEAGYGVKAREEGWDKDVVVPSRAMLVVAFNVPVVYPWRCIYTQYRMLDTRYPHLMTSSLRCFENPKRNMANYFLALPSIYHVRLVSTRLATWLPS